MTGPSLSIKQNRRATKIGCFSAWASPTLATRGTQTRNVVRSTIRLITSLKLGHRYSPVSSASAPSRFHTFTPFVLLSAITIYPVKSCRGISLKSAAVDTLGFVGDRRFMIVAADGTPLTQREEPRLALVETALSTENLRLSSARFSAIEIPLTLADSPVRRVEVWSSKGLVAEDCGDLAHQWISDLLGGKFWLVRIGAAFRRLVKNTSLAAPDLVSFADGFPFLTVSEASLADLNSRLKERAEPGLPMNRFRPNLVISECDAYAEDTWERVKIGPVTFRAGGPCARCVITTTDQLTGSRGKEPLRTLATYRRDLTDPGNVNFGQNLINEDKSGVVTVGDPVEPSK